MNEASSSNCIDAVASCDTGKRIALMRGCNPLISLIIDEIVYLLLEVDNDYALIAAPCDWRLFTHWLLSWA